MWVKRSGWRRGVRGGAEAEAGREEGAGGLAEAEREEDGGALADGLVDGGSEVDAGSLPRAGVGAEAGGLDGIAECDLAGRPLRFLTGDPDAFGGGGSSGVGM